MPRAVVGEQVGLVGEAADDAGLISASPSEDRLPHIWHESAVRAVAVSGGRSSSGPPVHSVTRSPVISKCTPPRKPLMAAYFWSAFFLNA